MGFISEMRVKFLDRWDEFNEWCGGGSRGLLVVAALALLALALLSVIFVPGLMQTGNKGEVVTGVTPTKQVSETIPTPAPTIASTIAPTAAPTPAVEPTPAPMMHTVIINPYATPKFELEPVNCTIARNDSVIWVNNDTLKQGKYILMSDDGLWQPVEIPFGSNFTYTFNSTRSYTYRCQYFPTLKGTITVKEH